MTPAEAAILLGKLAVHDGRTVSEAAARAWAETLPDITLTEALDAVPEHYRRSANWTMPVHILEIVREQRREARRLQREAIEAEREAIDAAYRSTLPDRGARVIDLLGQLRAAIPEGDPDKLRYATREWNRFRRMRDRRDEQPNPHYWARTGEPPPDADTA